MKLRDTLTTIGTAGRIASSIALERVLPHSPITDAALVPPSAEAITPEWLSTVLCTNFPGARVASIAVTGGDDGTSSRRALAVAYDGDVADLPTQLFTKSTATVGSRLLLGVTGIAEGESVFYNHVRAGLRLRSPLAFYSSYDSKSHRSLVILEDLTARRTPVNPLTGAYPTGSWGDESRDYHVAVRLSAKAVGQEQLASRVQLVVGEQVVAQGLVKARWSDDDGLTTRINPEVAHYTGQTELADAIQQGLAAKAAGDVETATTKLGRAVQLAAATGNEEATSRLRKVVDIDDEETGTVRLRRAVEKADEMALDTASTKTTRVRTQG